MIGRREDGIVSRGTGRSEKWGVGGVGGGGGGWGFFFNDTATTEIYTLSLHDALPIWQKQAHSKK